ncbi:MAG: CPBP family glutamic-type intramembrane protease [Planctomycetota bacterium]
MLASELRQLVRDRRALFAAVLLPALLYPLIFFISSKLETVGRESMAEREVTALLDVSRAVGGPDGDVARRARLALEARAPISLTEVDASPLLDLDGALGKDARDLATKRDGSKEERTDDATLRERALALIGPDAHVLVTARPSPESAERTRFEVWFDVQDDVAREGVSRVRQALRGLGDELRVEARDRLLGGDPGAGLSPNLVDVASDADKSGAALGRWLPFLALIVLISGGAYAALAVFAGEREAGTLETLLVQPVPHSDLARGKFLAVLIAGVVTVLVNLTSLITCAVTGLAKMPGFDAAGGALPFERLVGAALVLFAPCALLTALLCLVCGKARTFREGQMMLMPVTFAVILPTAIVLRPEAQLSMLTALVPFVGSGLALREALEGDLTLLLGALVISSHALWTFLLLGRVAHMLDGERALRDGRGAEAGSLALKAARHAQLSAFVVVMSLYLVAGAVQRADLQWGLVFTFWALLPAFALGIARLAPRRAGAGWLPELGLAAPRPHHVLGALLLVPALAGLAGRWLTIQLDLLPMPREALQAEGLGELFSARSTLWIFFFFALSPGVFEELVFRGSILSSMRRGMATWKVIALQGVWFALAHASVYRLVPTFVLGAMFAAIALRARSIWPTVLAHTAYNGLLVLGANGRLPDALAGMGDLGHWSHWLAPVGVALLALPGPGGAQRTPQ